MSVYLNEIKPLRLYTGKFRYPIDLKNRFNNSIVYLMTPNIKSTIKVLNNVNARENNQAFKSYFLEKNIQFIISKTPVKESLSLDNILYINEESYPYDAGLSAELDVFSEEDCMLSEDKFFTMDEDGNKIRIISNEYADQVFNEERIQTKYGVYNLDNIFRSMLYSERMKNQKDCIKIYDEIKKSCPFIQYTYTDPRLYKNKNLYYDWSYYTQIFMKNNKYTMERGLDVYYHFINRFISDHRFSSYTQRTILIPVDHWLISKDVNILDYKVSINPLSLIYRYMKINPTSLSNMGNNLFVFLTDDGYFTMDFKDLQVSRDYARFNALINNMARKNYNDAEYINYDSKNVIMNHLADKLTSGGIKITNLTANTQKLSKDELDKKGLLDNPDLTDDPEIKKAALVNKLESIASKSSSSKDAEEELDNGENEQDQEWLKSVLLDLQSDEGIQMNSARASRMEEAKKKYLNQNLHGKKISELLNEFKDNTDLPEEDIPIDSIDDSWKHIKFSTFNKVYDMEPDIVAMFSHFLHVSHPMNIVSLDYKDTSTSEDYITTWTCQYEDAETGKRYTMKLDIPNLINNRFMKLRGNEKVLIGQLMLLPITKTEQDTVQIVSNYNKIFVRRKSPNGFGKSTPVINKLSKALLKYKGKDIQIIEGNNSRVYKKYELPMEYIDMGCMFTKIKFKDRSFISFNMDELVKYPIDKSLLPDKDKKLDDKALDKKYLSIYVKDGKRQPILTNDVDKYILQTILDHDTGEFEKLYTTAAIAKRLMYSEASILNTTMPVILPIAYNVGLQKILDKVKVKYSFQEKRPSKGETYIKFSDGYLVYETTNTAQDMLLNGLMEFDTSEFSIKEINSKDMWLSILDDFGGRIKADGLDNFYDLMFDPITVEICDIMNIPNNYIDGMIYASDLLVDNKYITHTDLSSNRLRINEVIVGHLYQVLSKAYGNYRNMVKRNKGMADFSAKRSAVIDSILNHDQTSSDLSTLNPLLEAESANKVTFKGLSGMNSDRAFSMDKRTYDKSMLGVLGLSTGFASTVGINRQTTIDAGVINKRGFIRAKKSKELGNTSTFTIMEAISPLAINHDDPFRTAMAFTQTSQHQMIVKKAMPMLLTTGADEALPYLTSNKFSYKFQGKRGKVTELTDEYMIIQDLDTGKKEFVDLRETIRKNSDGGFYITTKLSPNVRLGQTLKHLDIVAYDKGCYSNAVGAKNDPQQLAYNIGTIAKVAIMNTDMGFEDSCVVDSSISEALSSEVCVCKDVSLDAQANVYNVVKIGQEIQEGEPLLVFQDSFDEKETNELLRSLSVDNEELSDLGRKHVRAKITGIIQDIKIFRTVDNDKLSPTLKKLVNDYDKRINKLKNVMAKNGIHEEYTLEPTYKLPQEGKLKNVEGVRIEFYIKVVDKFGIGDKLVFSQALKGVNSYIVPKGEEPYTDFRSNEYVNAFLTISGVMGRMVGSSPLQGLSMKLMIELARSCQEDLGIKWKPLQQILQED